MLDGTRLKWLKNMFQSILSTFQRKLFLVFYATLGDPTKYRFTVNVSWEHVSSDSEDLLKKCGTHCS